MFFSDKIVLVTQDIATDPLGQRIIRGESSRSAWANVGSISASESASAGQNGLTPSLRVTIHREDWHGEQLVRYGGEGYSVYRSYDGGRDTIELYLEKKGGVS